MKGVSVVFAVAFLTATAPAVLGARPTIQRFQAQFSETNEFWTDVCGFTVTFTVNDRGSFTQFADGSSRFRLRSHVTFSGPGGEIRTREAFSIFQPTPPIETVDEQTGTVTVVMRQTFRGLVVHLIAPGEGVLIRDAGRLSRTLTLVIDLDTGEVIEVRNSDVVIRGPHPQFSMPFEEFAALFCGALA